MVIDTAPRSTPGGDLPLSGVRVVEFGHVAAGPFAAMLLADLGADVVKVEGPRGDDMRNWPPHAIADQGPQLGHKFAALNRSKRSVLADLKDPHDYARIRAMCMAADVVVENYRPGTLAKLGLGFDDLATDHRGLIYCSISGFGQDGAYAQLGAYDVIIQAMSGLISVTGTTTGELVKSGVPVADFVSGLYAALGVCAHLPLTRSSRRSYRVDVPMLDCLLAISALQTSEYWGTGTDPGPRGTKHSSNAPYQVFVAADGLFAVAAGNARLWHRLCEAIGANELSTDPRFSTQQRRVDNQDALEEILNTRFRQDAADEWVTLLRSHSVPAGRVNSFSQVLNDQVVVSSGLVQPLPMPGADRSLTTAFPVRVDDRRLRQPTAAPRLGEHTDEVYAEWGVPR